MIIYTANGKRSVDVGGADVWISVYSTVLDTLGLRKRKVAMAIKFMETGMCAGKDGYETARQFNLVRDELAKIPPERAIYDYRDKKRKAPWDGNISPVITSCANLYTTADGKDLLYEVVSILTYAQIAETDVRID